VRATLSSLRIRNLALVEHLEWLVSPGFVAITGETGSGKSIIVGALQLILGERADKTLIRAGAENCSVEAVFEMQEVAELNADLAELGVEPCEERQLILKRAFTATGTNRQFVNGSATTLSVLKVLGDRLVDLHGPHDHQSLLSPEKQLVLLDAFAGADILRAKYGTHYQKLQALQREHEALASNEAALERELDLLRHQVAEIETAELRPGEEEELLARYSTAANSRRLLELSTAALARLVEADDAALSRLNEIGKLLRELDRIDPRAGSFGNSLQRALVELDDLASALQHYAEEVEIEPAQLHRMEERVSQFETLKRKYGATISEVIAFGEQAALRLQTLNSRGAELARLAGEIETARKALFETAAKLSAKREAAAPKLGASVLGHLRDLGFKKAGFSVQLTAQTQPGPQGSETVEFVFAPNPGEPPKPLRAIASSGEISRVMLALKSSLAAQDTISLLVFDEIDANVGGEIAHAVGAKMKALAKEHQALCITHLPQVAALAGAQFVVTKEYVDARTHSQLRQVEGRARVEEIARMLGGKTESALAHAETLLRG
jgi:DNA repair protein RecN (Recombination protein N)